jgi:calcineurin-like phosphoesterase family protein
LQAGRRTEQGDDLRSTATRECVRALLCAAFALAASTASGEVYRWVQYGRAGLEARAITDQPACPPARIDGQPAPMTIHAAPGGPFPIAVCALPVPAAAKSVAIADVPLTLPPAEPRRILVIGDTGCRIKGAYVQACNDPVAWPFRLIAEVAAHQKPDLVIHVGDYHYRETACPAGDAGCAGSPFGDTWPVWQADFFSPAETLLRVAPFVFVRGNHEECDRGGKGWSRALSPDAFDAESGCNRPEKPFVVRLPGLTLAVMDVSAAREDKIDETQVPLFHAQYRALAGTISGQTWLLQHRPIWSPGGVFAGKLVGDNKTLEAAARDVIPADVTLMLSGHHHLFQVLSYKTGQPAQIVTGNGGDYLNAIFALEPAGWTLGDVVVERGVNMPGTFGFVMFEKQADGWLLTDYDKLGSALKSCMLKGRAATC